MKSVEVLLYKKIKSAIGRKTGLKQLAVISQVTFDGLKVGRSVKVFENQEDSINFEYTCRLHLHRVFSEFLS